MYLGAETCFYTFSHLVNRRASTTISSLPLPGTSFGIYSGLVDHELSGVHIMRPGRTLPYHFATYLPATLSPSVSVMPSCPKYSGAVIRGEQVVGQSVLCVPKHSLVVFGGVETLDISLLEHGFTPSLVCISYDSALPSSDPPDLACGHSTYCTTMPCTPHGTLFSTTRKTYHAHTTRAC